jgi:hypothetical protein
MQMRMVSLDDALLCGRFFQSQPSLIRVHSFCFAFDVLEKLFLPKPRHTSFDRFSRDNQDALLQAWKSTIEADDDQWQQIAALKKSDASDAWQSRLAQTHLFQVWTELMKPELRCCQSRRQHMTDNDLSSYSELGRNCTAHDCS